MWYSPSLQQLLFMQTVLEEGTLVRAADRLHTTHSTISRGLKTLAEGLGLDLFVRTPRGLKPTKVGRAYGAHIRGSLNQARLAFDLANYEAKVERLPFLVGHSPYIHSGLLPLLETLSLPGSEAPEVVLKSGQTMQLVSRVLKGELQAGFGILPILDKDLLVEKVAHERFSVCIAEDHNFAKHEKVSARELRKETLFWIPRNVHRPFYDHIMRYLRTVKFDPQQLQEAQTITQALDFAAHSRGIALVPQSASRFQRPGVLFRPLTDELIRIETALFVRRDQMRAATKDFVGIARAGVVALKLNPLEKR